MHPQGQHPGGVPALAGPPGASGSNPNDLLSKEDHEEVLSIKKDYLKAADDMPLVLAQMRARDILSRNRVDEKNANHNRANGDVKTARDLFKSMNLAKLSAWVGRADQSISAGRRDDN